VSKRFAVVDFRFLNPRAAESLTTAPHLLALAFGFLARSQMEETRMSDAVLIALISAAGAVLAAWIQNRKSRRR
jgi:hypothetical protein